MVINFKDPFGNESIIAILPVSWNDRISFSVNSRRDYIASWDLETAKQILKALDEAIKGVEK